MSQLRTIPNSYPHIIQGRDAIWFVGAPASFDSVEAVFDYNRLLLGNLEREAAELCDYKGEPIYEPYHAGYV